MDLHVEIFGEGPRPLLAFHGIGQTGAGCFRPFGILLGEYFTIYAFDLPFHGESRAYFEQERWADGGSPVLPLEWQGFLSSFLRAYNIDKFSVAGFSLGGRFALATMGLFPDRIERAYLIAPDGLVDQPVYRLATGTALARSVFNFVMGRPRALTKLSFLLRKVGIIHSSVSKIIKYVLASGQSARGVYLSWVNFRKLNADCLYSAPSLSPLDGKWVIFLGKNDYLIRESVLEPLKRYSCKPEIKVLNTVHTSMVEQAAIAIRNGETS